MPIACIRTLPLCALSACAAWVVDASSTKAVPALGTCAWSEHSWALVREAGSGSYITRKTYISAHLGQTKGAHTADPKVMVGMVGVAGTALAVLLAAAVSMQAGASQDIFSLAQQDVDVPPVICVAVQSSTVRLLSS